MAESFADDRKRNLIAQHPACVEVAQAVQGGLQPILLEQVVDTATYFIRTLIGTVSLWKQKAILLVGCSQG